MWLAIQCMPHFTLTMNFIINTYFTKIYFTWEKSQWVTLVSNHMGLLLLCWHILHIHLLCSRYRYHKEICRCLCSPCVDATRAQTAVYLDTRVTMIQGLVKKFCLLSCNSLGVNGSVLKIKGWTYIRYSPTHRRKYVLKPFSMWCQN